MGKRRRRRNKPIFGNDPVPVRQQENAIKQRLKPYQTKFKAEVVEVDGKRAKIKRPGDEITVTLPQAEPAGSTSLFVENTIGFHFGQTIVAYKANDPNNNESLTVDSISEVDGTVTLSSPTTKPLAAGDKVRAVSGRGWNDVVGGRVSVGDQAWVLSDTGGVVVMGKGGDGVGYVKMWLGLNDPDPDNMILNGRLLSTQDYAELFALIGYTFGGSGSQFALPDMRSRSPMGVGTVSGLKNRSMGERDGAEEITLASSQMPTHHHTGSTSTDSHSHGANTGNNGSHNHGGADAVSNHTHGYIAHVNLANVAQGSGANIHQGTETRNTGGDGAHSHGITSAPDHQHSISSDSHSHSFSTSSVGGGGSHPNIHPVLCINFVVKVR